MPNSLTSSVARVTLGSALLLGLMAVAGAAVTASAASASGSPIVIGEVEPDTGPLSSNWPNAVWGAQAAFDAQNAVGGIDGHPIHVIEKDDASAPTTALTAAQVLVQSDNVLALLSPDPLESGFYNYAHQNGVAVIGEDSQGEAFWTTKPYDNVFSATGVGYSTIDGNFYYPAVEPELLKDVGVTKLAIVTVNVPSAVNEAKAVFKLGAPLGIKQCYLNTSLPVSGPADYTAVALAVKNAGCNGIYGAVAPPAAISLAAAFSQAGINPKSYYLATYYPAILSSPATLQSLSGTYTQGSYTVAGLKTMNSALKKYTPYPKNSVLPGQGEAEGYEEAEAVIAGLKLAGAGATRAELISKLQTIGNFTANGVLPSPVSFQHFGTPQMQPKTECKVFEKITSTGFVPYNNGKPLCAPNKIVFNAGS